MRIINDGNLVYINFVQKFLNSFDGVVYARKKNIPVVLVSRCPSGETLDTYSYPGAGKWLHKEGVIFADYLNGQKARIKLMLCLGFTKDEKKLVELIEEI